MSKLCRFIFFCILFAAAYVYSQQPERDSLYNRLILVKDTNGRILLLLEISKTYRTTFPDSAFLFADSAFSLATFSANKNLQHFALLSKGVASLRQKKYAVAEKNITDAKKYFIQTSDKFNEAECNKFLSNLCNEQGRYNEGEKYFSVALQLYEQLRPQSAPEVRDEIDKGIKVTFHFNYLAKFTQSDYPGALNILKISEKYLNKYNIKNAALYNSFGGVYANMGNHDSSLYYFLRGLNLAKELGAIEDELRYYNNIGYEYVKLSNYDKAIEYYSHGIERSSALKQFRTLGILYQNIGSVYEKQANYAVALNHYIKSLTILQQYGQPVEVASVYTLIGEYYLNQKLANPAIVNFDSALVILEKIKHKKRLAELYEKKGSVYILKREFEQAQSMFDSSLQMRLQLGNKDDIASAYYTLANFYLTNQKKLTDTAASYFNLAIDLNSKTKNGLLHANCITGLGRVAFAKNKFKDAVDYFKTSVQVCDSLKLKKELYENYQWLSKTYDALKNSEQSLYYFKLYSSAKDSVYNETIARQITEIETKYETEKKEKAIELLNKDNEIKSLALKKEAVYRNSIIAGGVLLLIIGLLLFNRFRISQKQKQQAERMRISADLHDEIGSTLSSISMYSSYAGQQLELNKTADAKNILTEIARSSHEMIDDMNDIIWAVNPSNDSFTHITDRLRNYASRIAQSKNILLAFTADETLNTIALSMQQRKNIYLICKEAVNNAVKYSNCKNLMLDFRKEKNKLCVSITDDGVGFDITQTTAGNGLKNMQQRANDLGAAFTITSSRESGTKINFEMSI